MIDKINLMNEISSLPRNSVKVSSTMGALSDQSRARSTSLGEPSLPTFVIYDFWQKTGGLYPDGDLS